MASEKDRSAEKTCMTDGYSNIADYGHSCQKIVKNDVIAIIDCFDVDHLGTFVMCDYGCADGGVELPLFLEIVDFLRLKYSPDKQIHIVFEDQASNNFSSVFHKVKESRLYQDNIIISASGTDMYKQCLPSNSLDFGFSSFALHWLSKRPCTLENALIHNQCANGSNAELYKQQAAEDWQNFLLKRAEEMKPGAYGLFLLVQCDAMTLQFSKELNNACQKMVRDKVVTQAEFESMSLPLYMRSMSEIKAPFLRPSYRVTDAGLCLKLTKQFHLPCTSLQQYQADIQSGEGVGAAARHARRLVASQRAWSYNFLRSALIQAGKDSASTEIILQTFYTNLEKEANENPTDVTMTVMQCMVVVNKTA